MLSWTLSFPVFRAGDPLSTVYNTDKGSGLYINILQPFKTALLA